MAALLLVAVIGYFGLVKPQKSKAASLTTEIAAQDKQITDARALLAKAKNAQKVRVADLFRLTKAMPDQPDEAGIVLELTNVARQSGIDFRVDRAAGLDTVERVSGHPDHRHLQRQLLPTHRFSLPAAQPRRCPPGRAGCRRPFVHGRQRPVQSGEAEVPTGAGHPDGRRLHLRHRRDRERAATDAGDDHREFGTTTSATTHDDAFFNNDAFDDYDSLGQRDIEPDRSDELMAKKKFDPKAKAKRQKVMLAVGSVLLLGLLAFRCRGR